jgi:hypothetical protein
MKMADKKTQSQSQLISKSIENINNKISGYRKDNENINEKVNINNKNDNDESLFYKSKQNFFKNNGNDSNKNNEEDHYNDDNNYNEIDNGLGFDNGNDDDLFKMKLMEVNLKSRYDNENPKENKNFDKEAEFSMNEYIKKKEIKIKKNENLNEDFSLGDLNYD